MPRSRSASGPAVVEHHEQCSLPCTPRSPRASADHAGGARSRYVGRPARSAWSATSVNRPSRAAAPAPRRRARRRARCRPPAGSQQRGGAARSPGGSRPGRPRPPKTASAGSWSATSGGHGGAVRHVRRVAQHHVDPPAQLRQQVRRSRRPSPRRPDPRPRPAGGVAAQPGQRRRRTAPRRSPGAGGSLVGDRERDRARAAAQVDHDRVAPARRPARCPSRPAARSPAAARTPRRRPPAPGAGTRPCRAGAATGSARPARATSSSSRVSWSSARMVVDQQPAARGRRRARARRAAPRRPGARRPRPRRGPRAALASTRTRSRVRSVRSEGCSRGTCHGIIMKRRVRRRPAGLRAAARHAVGGAW